jgi:hypothetical protein
VKAPHPRPLSHPLPPDRERGATTRSSASRGHSKFPSRSGAAKPPTPKGLHPTAQGKRSATLGTAAPRISTLKGLDTTVDERRFVEPLPGSETKSPPDPGWRGAARRLPWAVGSNPFGVPKRGPHPVPLPPHPTLPSGEGATAPPRPLAVSARKKGRGTAAKPPTPKGSHTTAQGKRSATLGYAVPRISTLKGLHKSVGVPGFVEPFQGSESKRTPDPGWRGATRRLPWAVGSNPFGVPRNRRYLRQDEGTNTPRVRGIAACVATRPTSAWPIPASRGMSSSSSYLDLDRMRNYRGRTRYDYEHRVSPKLLRGRADDAGSLHSARIVRPFYSLLGLFERRIVEWKCQLLHAGVLLFYSCS